MLTRGARNHETSQLKPTKMAKDEKAAGARGTSEINPYRKEEQQTGVEE